MSRLRTGLFVAVCLLWAGAAGAKDEQTAKSIVPRTGQLLCYDSDGLPPIPCAKTGQDGDVKAGIESPSPRFTDNDNGTITDNLTKLIWLKNANCKKGQITWQEALSFANNLASGDCELTDASKSGDWRLPNIRELQSLVDYGNSRLALPNPKGAPFKDFQASIYWSSTTNAFNPVGAWFVFFFGGNVNFGNKTNGNYALAVRGGS